MWCGAAVSRWLACKLDFQRRIHPTPSSSFTLPLIVFVSSRSLQLGSSLHAHSLAIHLQHLVMVSQGDLGLVGRLLVVLPGILAVTLLLGHHLVLHLDLLHVGVLAGLRIIFEHAAHTKDVLLLSGVGGFLVLVGLSSGGLLALLLIGPLKDVHLVLPHSVVVH